MRFVLWVPGLAGEEPTMPQLEPLSDCRLPG